MNQPHVSPGAVIAFTDVMCGWSTLAFHRFNQARAAAGLEDVTQMALNTKTIEGEKPVIGALAEQLNFKPWQRDPSEYPVTSLPANEAVHAAKEQSARAAKQLDMALRLAFWSDSRCISMQHEILAIADDCDQVNPPNTHPRIFAGCWLSTGWTGRSAPSATPTTTG